VENSPSQEDKVREKAVADPALDWKGDDAKTNPLNWPLRARLSHTGMSTLHCSSSERIAIVSAKHLRIILQTQRILQERLFTRRTQSRKGAEVKHGASKNTETKVNASINWMGGVYRTRL
jgi:hypothetical protein